MAREIRGTCPSGTLYARIINPSGLWWNGTTFEAYSAGNYADYDVAMTEQGNSGVYVADFPAAILTGGTYEYFVHRQAGASPAEGDPVVNTGKIDWSGTVSISSATGSMSGSDFRDYLVNNKGFCRTDKDATLYAAVTDAIQKLRRKFAFDEAEVDATTTDTIATLGDFKLDIESDLGLLQSIILQDGEVGTPLEIVSKDKFNNLYPGINVESDRGYPLHASVYAGSIYIGPIPDSVAYTYRLNYSRRAGTITSSTTGVPFTNLYRDLLADLTLSILYDSMDEHDKASYYRGLFADGYLDATRRESKNAGGSTFNMVPTNF